MRPRENDTHGSDNRYAMPVVGIAVLTVTMSYTLYRTAPMRHSTLHGAVRYPPRGRPIPKCTAVAQGLPRLTPDAL